jgi:hypothetical protein
LICCSVAVGLRGYLALAAVQLGELAEAAGVQKCAPQAAHVQLANVFCAAAKHMLLLLLRGSDKLVACGGLGSAPHIWLTVLHTVTAIR